VKYAGRVRPYNVYLNDSLYECAKRVANDMGVSLSEMLRIVIREECETLKLWADDGETLEEDPPRPGVVRYCRRRIYLDDKSYAIVQRCAELLNTSFSRVIEEMILLQESFLRLFDQQTDEKEKKQSNQEHNAEKVRQMNEWWNWVYDNDETINELLAPNAPSLGGDLSQGDKLTECSDRLDQVAQTPEPSEAQTC